MKVRYKLVDEYEKCPAEQETYYRGQKTQRAVCFFCTLDRRNEQRPYGRRHHDSRSKPQKQRIEFTDISPLKKNTSAAPAVVAMKMIQKPSTVIAVVVKSALLSCRYFFPTNSLECASIYALLSFLVRNNPSVVSMSSTFSKPHSFSFFTNARISPYSRGDMMS